MKYKGVKYKRKVTGSGNTCRRCDMYQQSISCPVRERCIDKDAEKRNVGYYKEVLI